MKNVSKKLFAGASVLGLAIMASATPVLAQTAGSAADENNNIGDIIVTAQKSSTSLDDVAASIGVASGGTLAQAGVRNATELGKAVAGVSVAALGTVTNLNVRGVSSSQFSALGGSSVGFVLDGVPIEGNVGISTGFYDLDRVEVLKGPQGTLYGLNATGGVISVVSARPRIGELSGGVDVEGGNYDSYKATAHVNVPLGQNLAARVSGMYNHRDGTIQNVYNDADEGGFRGQLLYEADSWSLLVAGDWYHQGGVGQVNIPLPFGARGTDADDPFDQHYYGADPTDAYIDHTYWGVRAELNADLGFANLTFLPSYREIHTDEISYQASYRGDVKSDVWQASVEARLSNESDHFDWMLGGYFYWGERKYDGFFFNPDSIGAPLENYYDASVLVANGVFAVTPKDSQAVFGQATFKTDDNFRFVLGMRYSRDKRAVERATDSTLNYLANPPFLPPSLIPVSAIGGIPVAPGSALSLESLAALDPTNLVITSTTVNQSATFTNFDFKVGVQYDVGPDTMLYANVATGYKAGGINTFAAGSVGTSYKPEVLTSYDAGVRTRFGNLRFHVNAFYWDYKDHQEGAIYIVPGVGIKLLIENLPKGYLYGADMEASWRPTKNDTLDLQVAWLKSNTGPFTLGGGSFVEPVGHEYASAPRWTINGSYEHIFELGDFELVARATGHFQSKSNLEIRFDPANEQDAYFTGDAFLTVRPESQQWYIGAYVRNFTDEVYLSSAAKAPGPGSNFWGFLGMPRTYGVRAGFNF